MTGDKKVINKIESINGETLGSVELIILKSEDGNYPWVAIKPADIPSWMFQPNIAAHLKQGHALQHSDDTAWYRAEPMPDGPVSGDEVH